MAELASLRDENANIRRQLLEGDLPPGTASVAVQSLNADARLILAAIKAREAEEFAERLAALEEYHEGQQARQERGGW